MIKVSMLSCSQGDTKIIIDDANEEDRKKLAGEIVSLLTKGIFIVVVTKDGQSLRISGYDAVNNDWIVHAASIPKEINPVLPKKRGRPRKTEDSLSKPSPIKKKSGAKKMKVSAQDSSVTAIAPIAGG